MPRAVKGAYALLVGAFSVIVKTDCGTDGALHSTNPLLSTLLNFGNTMLRHKFTQNSFAPSCIWIIDAWTHRNFG